MLQVEPKGGKKERTVLLVADSSSISCISLQKARSGHSGGCFEIGEDCYSPFAFPWRAHLGFPNSSAGKESACNAGGPGLIPGLGRSSGEGIGYPLQYSWASMVAQLVKNPPAMLETWI